MIDMPTSSGPCRCFPAHRRLLLSYRLGARGARAASVSDDRYRRASQKSAGGGFLDRPSFAPTCETATDARPITNSLLWRRLGGGRTTKVPALLGGHVRPGIPAATGNRAA